VRTAINDGTPFKACATEGCKEILTPKTCFNYFRNNEAIYDKYKRFLLQTIVDTSFNVIINILMKRELIIIISYYGAQEQDVLISFNC